MKIQDRINRLEEVKDEIKELVKEARRLCNNTSEEKRCDSYWHSHIVGALDNDHGYLGCSFYTLQDSIDELIDEGMVDCPICAGEGCSECEGLGCVDSVIADEIQCGIDEKPYKLPVIGSITIVSEEG